MKMVALVVGVLLLFMSGGHSNPVLVNSFKTGDSVHQEDVSSNCPTGYSQPVNSNWDKCYKVFTNYKSRKNAAVQCKANNGTLASVPNAFVNSYIYSLATQSSVTSLWLGIQCFNGDVSSCINDDGTNFVYNNFAPGQPTSQDICEYMSTIGKDSQLWSTFDCEQNFQSVCEVATLTGGVTSTTTVSPTTTTTTTTRKNGTCPAGWTAFQGMCYAKLRVHDQTRKMQSDLCKQTPGGNLATIYSKEVNIFLSNLTCDSPYVRFGLQCPNVTRSGDTSTCVWDDGTPFNYNNFAQGEPSQLYLGGCAYTYESQWYTEISCEQSFYCGTCQAPMQ